MDSCGTQECSFWIHNKDLHDHGEQDDVDPDDDFRFDIIYRHRDTLTRQMEDGVSINMAIDKGDIQDGRDEIKNIVSWETFRPDTKVLRRQLKLLSQFINV